LRHRHLIALLALAAWSCAAPPSPNTGSAAAGDAVAATPDASGLDSDAAAQADVSQAGDGAELQDSPGELAAGDAPQAEAGACLSGSPCDDGDKCTAGDKCLNGQCLGQPLDCGQGLPPCKKAACEPGSGLCLISDKDGACDDGDPCTQADTCLLGACTGMAKPGCCTVNCAGKACGGDGCGGSCGNCPTGEVCGSGSCVKSTPAGETCADATPIPALPFGHSGSTANAKNDLQAPDKACYNAPLGTYGPDVVYRYKAPADQTIGVKISGSSNKPAVYITPQCGDLKNACLAGALGFGQGQLGPIYAKIAKNQEVFIIVDADSAGGDYTLDVTTCAPNCSGKQCGSDGCGGVCGECAKLSAYNCSTAGTCLCVADCKQKTCGDNGCGGSCGSCDGGKVCDDGIAGGFTGQCIAPGQKGDTCATAIAVDKAEFTYSGSTAGLGNHLYGWAFCQGNGTGAYYGDEAPDMVFALGGQEPQTWHVELTKQGSNLELYALSDCLDPTTCQQAGYQGFALKTQILVESPSKAPIFAVVDGYSDQAGTFTLVAKHCKAPSDCPSAIPGEYCSFAAPMGPLPFKAQGSLGIDSYFLPKGACGAGKDLGKGGGNKAYALQAAKTGKYKVTAVGTGGMDPILYAAKDCTKLASTCGGYADKTGEKGTETLEISAVAGETWYVVVDGPTSAGGSFSLEVVGP
jgi:hypothetical protein